MEMPFGKHEGTEVDDLPSHYLFWLSENCELYGDLASEIESELAWRWEQDDPWLMRCAR